LLKEFGGMSQGAPLAEPATRALVGIFERTKNAQLLRALDEVLGATPPVVRVAALTGLDALDHPLAIEIARRQRVGSRAPVRETAARGYRRAGGADGRPRARPAEAQRARRRGTAAAAARASGCAAPRHDRGARPPRRQAERRCGDAGAREVDRSRHARGGGEV